jgi:hypothetical protein
LLDHRARQFDQIVEQRVIAHRQAARLVVHMIERGGNARRFDTRHLRSRASQGREPLGEHAVGIGQTRRTFCGSDRRQRSPVIARQIAVGGLAANVLADRCKPGARQIDATHARFIAAFRLDQGSRGQVRFHRRLKRDMSKEDIRTRCAGDAVRRLPVSVAGFSLAGQQRT